MLLNSVSRSPGDEARHIRVHLGFWRRGEAEHELLPARFLDFGCQGSKQREALRAVRQYIEELRSRDQTLQQGLTVSEKGGAAHRCG
jgi:hypothetical protein